MGRIASLPDLIAACAAISRSDLEAQILANWVADLDLCPELITSLAVPDPTRPYGRRVLFADAHLELMLASWTPNTPCAPHDHGGSIGFVRILRGSGEHILYRAREGSLAEAGRHPVDSGEVLPAYPELVHAMQAAPVGLLTLHAYTGPIPFMVVWDLMGARTLRVSGGCGAWVPHDEPELLLDVWPGLLPPNSPMLS
jgi:cysteine dioxygenase